MNYYVAIECGPDEYIIARSDDPGMKESNPLDHVGCVGFWLLSKDEVTKRVNYMNGAFDEGVEFAKKKFLAQIKAGLAQW